MTETTGSAPAVVTPGQADWEARRDSSFARAGLPAGDQFVSWHRLSAEERADSEAGAQAAIAAAKWPANLTLRDTLDYLAGQWESNASPHNFKDPAEQVVARRYAADLRAALRAADVGATQEAQPDSARDALGAQTLHDSPGSDL